MGTVSDALYLIGWTGFMGLITLLCWRRLHQMAPADMVRSTRLDAVGACLFCAAATLTPGALVLGGQLTTWIVLVGYLAGGLTFFVARLTVAGERSHTERARRAGGGIPRQRMLPVAVVVAFWIALSFVAFIVTGIIVFSADPPSPSSAPDPGFNSAVVAIVTAGLIGGSIHGAWQHYRIHREDARLLRSDREAAQNLDTTSPTDPDELL